MLTISTPTHLLIKNKLVFLSTMRPQNPSIQRRFFATPYGLFSSFFVIAPLIIVFYYAFTSSSGKFSLDNFKDFWYNEAYIEVLLKSLLMAAVNTAICLVLGFSIAYILGHPRYNKNPYLVLLFIMPMWINSLLRTIAMRYMLEWIGMSQGYGMIMVGLVSDFLPFMILPLYTTIANLDYSCVDAAHDLGATHFDVFFKVILPLSVPGIVSGSLMVFMPTISTFFISDILGNANTFLFGNIINQLFSKLGITYGWNMGSALSIIMLLLIGISVVSTNRYNKVYSNRTEVW